MATTGLWGKGRFAVIILSTNILRFLVILNARMLVSTSFSNFLKVVIHLKKSCSYHLWLNVLAFAHMRQPNFMLSNEGLHK